jgi:glycolate oxidase iron-sulfur subunit
MFNLMDFDFDAVNQETHEGFYIPPFSDCMRCGICVSSCPTFQLSQDQAESPRSRLQTIRKLLIENTLISADERAHLDSCLQCRACETICPSKMAYGQLVNRAQEKLLHNSSFLGKLGLFFIAHKSWQTAAMIPLH